MLSAFKKKANEKINRVAIEGFPFRKLKSSDSVNCKHQTANEQKIANCNSPQKWEPASEGLLEGEPKFETRDLIADRVNCRRKIVGDP